MALISLRPAAPRATPLTSTTTSVLRHLDATVVSGVLRAAAPALGTAGDVALLVEGRDGHRVSGSARELLATTPALLLVVTADRTEPAWLVGLEVGTDEPGRVVWCSSEVLASTVDEVLARTPQEHPGAEAVTELSRTLLTELLGYWDAHGLRFLHDTVVVAGRAMWPEYLRTGAVITEPGHDVRAGTTHVGFYVDDAIAAVVPAIEGVHRAVRFTAASAERHRQRGEGALADVIDASLDSRSRTEGATYGVLLLSPPDADGTVRLEVRVEDDVTTPHGRRAPWTLTQRYTHLGRLRSGVTVTSQL